MSQLSREKILIISPIVPRPDMNSGDVRLCSLILILAQKYELTFISTDVRSGDGPYIAVLNQAGVTVYSEPFSLWSLLKNEKFMVAILEFYSIAEFYLDRIRILQPECRIVVDTVDVHYLRLKQKYDLTKDAFDLSKYQETREKELCIYRRVDAVITVTKEDEAALLADSSEIICEVVPNIHEICLGETSREKSTLIFVGGFSHEPNVDAVLYFCRDILPLIRNKKPDVHFMIVGSNPPDEIKMLEDEYVTVTGYVPETTPYLHRSCVSVAPLRFGAGMKGKIGEAMAHGVPVVTTSVGAHGMGLDDRNNVLIADSPHDFAYAVLELLDNSWFQEHISSNAIQYIDDNYTSRQVTTLVTSALARIGRKPAKIMNLYEKLGFLNKYLAQKVKARLFAH